MYCTGDQEKFDNFKYDYFESKQNMSQIFDFETVYVFVAAFTLFRIILTKYI